MDTQEAAKWFMLSAEGGNVSAQSILAEMYSQGEGVEMNTEEALRWYRLLADTMGADKTDTIQ